MVLALSGGRGMGFVPVGGGRCSCWRTSWSGCASGPAVGWGIWRPRSVTALVMPMPVMVLVVVTDDAGRGSALALAHWASGSGGGW